MREERKVLLRGKVEREKEREKNTQYKSWKRKKKASLTDFSREKKGGSGGTKLKDKMSIFLFLLGFVGREKMELGWVQQQQQSNNVSHIFFWALECGMNFGMFCTLALPPPLYGTPASRFRLQRPPPPPPLFLPEWCERRAKYIFIFLALGGE